jgi:hypothetical protein
MAYDEIILFPVDDIINKLEEKVVNSYLGTK